MLDGGPAQPVNFTATGTFAGGQSAPLNVAQLTWEATRADATPPGTINQGSLTPFAKAGGVVTITARDGCGISGSTTITFSLQVTVGTPQNPDDWGGTPVTSGTVPTIVYPSDQTRFPRNIYRTLFQWRTGSTTQRQFRMTFDGPGSHVVVYTDGAHTLCAGKTPAAGCFEADERTWSYLAGSNAGQTITWTLDALDTSTSPPTVRRAPPITIGFSRQDVPGAIFYWSTTSAGVRRATLSSPDPEDYIVGKPPTTYTAPNDQVQCVACHVVSRDGKYMAAPTQAASGQSLWILQVSATAPPPPLVKSVPNTKGHGFATFSPDDRDLVVAWGGTMWRIDRATGATRETLPTGGPATHPDWSPDNTQVAYATANGDAPSGASLATIPWSNPGWGQPRVLVPAAGLSNLFPRFSQDGQWIAYSRGKGGHDDLAAQLFIVPAAGGQPVELLNANRVVSNRLGTGQTENSQPTWAPDGDLAWIAFNSQREYGVVLPQGTQQIWVAAVDLSKAGTGTDPSYPAFRLQFQGLQENNHRAYWTLDVRDPVPPPDGGTDSGSGGTDGGVSTPDAACTTSIPAGQTCDPLNDCCQRGYRCDTLDNGVTYTCVQIIS
ncbi:MAG TPA: hypothetical protein VH877_15860 [Polyangia bacterium]|nr:hypothetical protein [Polyangia bacterium]